jgi:hypothetical protein
MKLEKTKIKFLSSSYGQTVVEYLLVMASAAAILVLAGIYFHKKLIGRFFYVLGLILG